MVLLLLYIYTEYMQLASWGGGGGDDKSESQAYELAAMFMGTE